MMNSKTIVSALAVAAVLGLTACDKKEPAPVALPDTPPAVETTTVAPVTEVPASGAGLVHEHGSADLSIALDGSTLSVTLEAPLANFVSFEHAPETPEQKQALQDVRAGFMRVSRNVSINGGAGCEFASREVGFNHTGDHGSITVGYGFTCATPGELTSVRLSTFEDYPGLTSAAAVFLGPNGQKAKKLTPEDNSIWLK